MTIKTACRSLSVGGIYSFDRESNPNGAGFIAATDESPSLGIVATVCQRPVLA